MECNKKEVYIEIINAKNIPYVIRDFNMEIWNKGKRIDSMVQSNEGTREAKGIIEKTFYGENGIYSFLIEAMEIAFGSQRAKAIIKDGTKDGLRPGATKAWKWAISMTPKQRKAAWNKLKKTHSH